MFSYESNEEAIIRLHKSGVGPWRIHEITHIRYPRVKQTIQYYQMNGCLPNSAKPGRPSHLTNTTLAAITALTIENRFSSCYSISQLLLQQGILLSTTSVWRGRKNLQFNFKQPKIRQALNDEQQYYRLKFAHSMLCSDLNFQKIIFSDESRFCLGSDNIYRWYRKGENDDQVFKDTEKYNPSIMMFGAIGYNYKSKLVVCSGHVDSMGYRKLIQEANIVEDLNNIYGEGQYLFMQDGAPAHTSAISYLYLQKRMSYIKSWPANSPDLNPIEHLWGAIKRILKTKQISSKAELLNTVQEIWENFPQEVINRLVLSFHGRLRTVIQENGGSIAEYLRKGIHLAPDMVLNQFPDMMNLDEIIAPYDPNIDDNPIEVKTKRPWTYQEIKLLLDKVNELGKKWTVISGFFEDRTPISIANKFKSLTKTG